MCNNAISLSEKDLFIGVVVGVGFEARIGTRFRYRPVFVTPIILIMGSKPVAYATKLSIIYLALGRAVVFFHIPSIRTSIPTTKPETDIKIF
jgi:hypothetical protein